MLSDAIEAAGYTYFVDAFGPSADFNGWPMIQKFWNGSASFSWESVSGLSRAYYNLGLILNTFVFLDTFDASQNVLHVSEKIVFET